jgi:hypothetical protein
MDSGWRRRRRRRRRRQRGRGRYARGAHHSSSSSSSPHGALCLAQKVLEIGASLLQRRHFSLFLLQHFVPEIVFITKDQAHLRHFSLFRMQHFCL